MGGPWFRSKDKGAWSIPKGEYSEGEDPKKTARREFKEELSLDVPSGQWTDLGTVQQKNNKTVVAWAVQGDLDASRIKSNTARGEWPPRSGKIVEWPEIDKAGWFSLNEAAQKLISAQAEFLERLAKKLNLTLTKPEQNSLF